MKCLVWNELSFLDREQKIKKKTDSLKQVVLLAVWARVGYGMS